MLTPRLVHPHIVRLLDFALEQGMPFLVLDYAPGGSLRTHHPKGCIVPLDRVTHYLKELVPALQYAHDQHILHRDIKPDNMLIGRGGELLLSDFGIAVLRQTGRTSLSSAYSIGGTPYYMAPETYRGKPEKASDQYALAIAIYEWLCGCVPFTEGDFIQLGYQHAHEPVPSLRAKNPSIPAFVEEVILKALAKEPKDRFESVQAFAEAFIACSVPGSHSRPQLMTPLMNDPAPILQPTVTPVSPAQAPHPAEPAAATKATGAGCQIKLPDGSYCGVTTLGRCTTCGRAFCASHQAWNGQTYYLNQCAPCLAQAQVDEEKRRQEAAAKYRARDNEAREYIQSGSARTALLTAGVRPVNIYQTQRKEEKKGFFGGYQWVEVVTSVRHGWVLGPFSWDVGEYGHRRLTALLDLDQVVFTWVAPYLESYKELGVTQLGDDRDNCKISKYEILEVAEAIKRLIELNHLGVQSIFTRRLPAKHDDPPIGRQVLAGKSGFLRIEEGEEPGRIYEIHKEAFLIGNYRESDINLTRTGNVSTNEHAFVMNLGNGIYTLKASSEVKINGQKLDEGQLYPLQEGDHIQVKVFLRDQPDRTGLLESQTVLVFGTK